MNKLLWLGGILLFASLVFLSGLHGALVPALFSLILLVILCLTALPISEMLFPKRMGAFLFAFPLGYLLHSVILSICASLFPVNKFILLTYVVIGILVLFLWRRRKELPPMEDHWTGTDTAMLLLWLLLTLTAVALPFINVGVETPKGLAYRAYFNGDFFRNMAVVGSLFQGGAPPVNPYFGGRELHYYWFFHIVPAYWKTLFPGYRPDLLLVQFSLAAVCMFIASLFYVARSFVVERKSLLFLFPVLLLGGSYKGVYVLQQLHSRNLPWHHFTAWNIDGILRWFWNVPQIDTLYRAMLYAPQHLIAFCVFLASLLVWVRSSTIFQRVILCVLIIASIGLSTFVGGALVLTGGVIVLYRAARGVAGSWRELAGWLTVGSIFLVLYFFVFRMFHPGSQRILFGTHPVMIRNLFFYLVLNWGPLLFLGLGGIFWHMKRFPARILTYFLSVCFFFILFVRIDLPGVSDISLKLGHFANVVLVLLAAGLIDRALVEFPAKAKWLVAAMFVLLLPSALSWWMDSYNSRDVQNTTFTTYVSRDDRAVLDWMRARLPPKAVVLNCSVDYREFVFDQIPPLAERPVYLGDRVFFRIFQISKTEIEQRKSIVSSIFRSGSGEHLWRIVQGQEIGYLFFSSREAKRVSKLRSRLIRPYFSLLRQEGDSYLFRTESSW